MLTHLHISNYALIDSLDLDLGADFTVITGETGAGKSIILGALGLLQGHRADAKVLRRADAKCIVEGTFDTAGLPIEPLLEAAEIEADGHTLLIRREISAAGKSRAFVNDTPATLNVLRQLAEHLIDIHSQHQNLLLSHENYLLDTLDLVADNAALRQTYAQSRADHRAARRRLQELQELSGRDGQDRDYISFQLEQIDGSAFLVDEQAQLEADSEALTHAEDIQSALAHAATRLSNDEFDVLDCLRQAESDLRDAARHRPETEALADRLESARIEIDDILSDVERLADSVEIDPVGLERTNRRLSKLYALQRKHNVETIASATQCHPRTYPQRRRTTHRQPSPRRRGDLHHPAHRSRATRHAPHATRLRFPSAHRTRRHRHRHRRLPLLGQSRHAAARSRRNGLRR